MDPPMEANHGHTEMREPIYLARQPVNVKEQAADKVNPGVVRPPTAPPECVDPGLAHSGVPGVADANALRFTCNLQPANSSREASLQR